MYAPATPVQRAPVLEPAGVVSAPPAFPAAHRATTMKARRALLTVLERHSSTVAGAVLEDDHAGEAGRVIALQALIGRGWRTIATAHTAERGRFRISFRPHRLGSRLLRLRFRADATVSSTRRRPSRLNPYRLAGSSWHGGGRGLACRVAP